MKCTRLFPLTMVLVTSMLAPIPSLAQDEMPTAYLGVGDDLDADIAGLREAISADPENKGLRMRLAQALLEKVKTADVRETREILKEVESQMRELIALHPGFIYPYRVLAKLHYRRGDFAECLATLEAYEKVGLLDYEMRVLYFKSILHLARQGGGEGESNEERVQAEKRRAAEYVGAWFDSGAAPPFGTTLGALRSWVMDPEFRGLLLEVFENRYRKNPRNVNLIISYAACLSVLGRNESAWRLVHEGEKVGLCDTKTGARHPIAYLLEFECPEDAPADAYSGSDLDALRMLAKEHPENLSLKLRLALQLKTRALISDQVAKACERQIDRKRGEDPAANVADLQVKRAEFAGRARSLFEEALPLAVEVGEKNPNIDAVPLLLGDIYYKLGRLDDAAQQLERSSDLAPFIPELIDVTALVYKEKKDWRKAAEALATVCSRVSCHADEWETDATDSLLPVPKLAREKMIVEMVEMPEARRALIEAFERVAAEKPGNPNIRTFLAMIHYFAGNKSEAIRWMREAERAGICGRGGAEHFLATLILSRERW